MHYKLPPVNITLLVQRLVEKEAADYIPTPLESKTAHVNRRTCILTEALNRTFAQAEEGYSLLINELESDSERDMKPFLLDSHHDVALDSTKPIILYERFGWTEQILAEFYNAAKKIYSKQGSQEAIDAFSFLTIINPLIAEFWSALASAYEKDGKFDEASDTHEIALYLSPKGAAIRNAAVTFYRRHNLLDKLTTLGVL